MANTSFEKLITPFGEAMDKTCPLPEYPRPQMVRDSYINLNGEWDYAINKKGEAFHDYQGKILVPFSPESILSGVEKTVLPDDVLRYRRHFSLPEGFNVGRVLLHFGAVDYEAKVLVNGTVVTLHRGGYYPFYADVTDSLREGENELTVEVTDPSDTLAQAHGKQKLKRGGIFYTPQSGIWQTVWLESVPESFIESLRLTPDIDSGTLHVLANIVGNRRDGRVLASISEKIIGEGELKNGECLLHLDEFELWSSEHPVLYDLTVSAGSDEVRSYFGMRKFSIGTDEGGKPRLMLNNAPYFHNGLLDQGYWSDGLYTAPSDEAMIYDVKLAKDMGFNMLRKHIKLEPLRWYYHCDRLGMLVWQDMVNGGIGAHKLFNAAIGFLGLTYRDSHYGLNGRRDKFFRDEYYVDTERTINGLYNVVSLAVWVPFNESWGQFDANKAVEFIRSLDNTRAIDHASGWHDQGGGDFLSLHIYFRPVRIPERDKRGRVVALTEFGGYSLSVPDHVFNKEKSFGYKAITGFEEFENSYVKLFEEQIIPNIKKGLSATVYTQLSDVEDEINGLVTYDRRVVKISPEKLKALNGKIKY